MLRRSFIRLLASGVLFALLGVRANGASHAKRYTFEHGVASGDPLTNGVILWTRVSGADGESVAVSWRVSSDPGLTPVLASGVAETNSDRDYTVKVDARDLPAGQTLYYQFTVGDVDSPLGTTRTLPHGGVERVRFAVVSCSNHPAGYFHAYREIANRDDLDAVIHLGDYIYEYGMGEYATQNAEALDRIPDPPTEIVSLSDYRRRYAQYRADPDLRAMHAAHPLIVVWDDHEIANDAWQNGAENHSTDPENDEGPWRQRRDAAIEAWFEWMPVRGEPNDFSRTTLRPFGPRVTFTASASLFTPRRTAPRASSE